MKSIGIMKSIGDRFIDINRRMFNSIDAKDPSASDGLVIYSGKAFGGSKRKSRKSRKSRKTKKGRGAYEGGKKKCPKHCRRKTRHTRKRLKYRKN